MALVITKRATMGAGAGRPGERPRAHASGYKVVKYSLLLWVLPEKGEDLEQAEFETRRHLLDREEKPLRAELLFFSVKETHEQR